MNKRIQLITHVAPSAVQEDYSDPLLVVFCTTNKRLLNEVIIADYF